MKKKTKKQELITTPHLLPLVFYSKEKQGKDSPLWKCANFSILNSRKLRVKSN